MTRTAPRRSFKWLPGEIAAFTIKPHLPPSEYCAANIRLSSGYTDAGAPLRAHPWQKEPMDAIDHWKTVLLMGPTQTGKSLIADAVQYTFMDRGINGIVAYDRMDTIKDVFAIRIVPMFEVNPALRELWNGKADCLTQENIILKNCFWRVASAANERTMSTFPAGIFIGSEVGKWQTQKGVKGESGFNPIEMLRGRGGSYYGRGGQKGLLESTPRKIGDYLYQEVYKSGTLILNPYFACPHCGQYHSYTDAQIKLRKTGTEEPDHNPERIRAAKSASCFYECPNCAHEITEAERVMASTVCIWAAPKIEKSEGWAGQDGETVTPDGKVIGDRSRYGTVCYNWNRLVDVAFPFWECLAQFFSAKNDPERMIIYQTECMARYHRIKSTQVSISFIESHKGQYWQHGDNNFIPDGPIAFTGGIDSQDKGFFYTVIGWGYMMKWWLIRHDYIHCPIDESEFLDRSTVYSKLRAGIFAEPYRRKDGNAIEIRQWFIDRGGHRPEDVDYIVEHMPEVEAYIGMTQLNPKLPLVNKSDRGPFYLGQTESLSLYTGKMLEGTNYELPQDVGPGFLRQIMTQYFISKLDIHGRPRAIWIHGGEDHYRDCFNLAYAAAKLIGLDQPDCLYDAEFCKQAAGMAPQAPIQEEDNQQQTGRVLDRSGGSYFDRAINGRS